MHKNHRINLDRINNLQGSINLPINDFTTPLLTLKFIDVPIHYTLTLKGHITDANSGQSLHWLEIFRCAQVLLVLTACKRWNTDLPIMKIVYIQYSCTMYQQLRATNLLPHSPHKFNLEIFVGLNYLRQVGRIKFYCFKKDRNR